MTEPHLTDQTQSDEPMINAPVNKDQAVKDQPSQSQIDQDLSVKDPADNDPKLPDQPVKDQDQSPTSSSSLVEGIDRSTFSRLTKRNQQFMIDLDKHLLKEDLPLAKRQIVYQEMVDTLIDGQASSQTARQLYGTPLETARLILDQEIQVQEQAQVSPDWQIAVDGGLILGSIFTFFTGLGLTLRPNEVDTGFMMGLITVIINYVVAGYAMLRTSKVMPNVEAPKGKRGYGKYFLVSTLSMLAWIGLVLLSQVILPHQINPILSGPIYLIIAALTFALHFYLKRKWHIVGGLF